MWLMGKLVDGSTNVNEVTSNAGGFSKSAEETFNLWILR